MNQDELIGILRGFCVGDDVVFHLDYSRRLAFEPAVESRQIIRQQRLRRFEGRTGTITNVLDVPPEHPYPPIACRTQDIGWLWVYPHEIVYHYEDQND